MESNLSSFDKIEQKISGSRKTSNYIIGGMLTIGGIGFILASLSSYTGKDLPIDIIWLDRENHDYSTTRMKRLIFESVALMGNSNYD